uniref:Immunoglobulin domain-containing protein n=1 Tax=Dromaius novaehollandiae TaxID=8790 RepID=A0A8C4JYB3_DRONO
HAPCLISAVSLVFFLNSFLTLFLELQGPKPVLSILPGHEVTAGSDVLLQCIFQDTNAICFLYLEGQAGTLHSFPEKDAKFHLSQVKQGNGGRYSCQCYIKGTPPKWSSTSEYLELVVRGETPPPHLILPSFSHYTGKGGKICFATGIVTHGHGKEGTSRTRITPLQTVKYSQGPRSPPPVTDSPSRTTSTAQSHHWSLHLLSLLQWSPTEDVQGGTEDPNKHHIGTACPLPPGRW